MIRKPRRPMRTVTLRERLRYAFDNTMSKGTKALVGWLALVTILLIAIFSAIVLLSGLAPGTLRVWPAVLWMGSAFTVMTCWNRVARVLREPARSAS